LVSETKGSVILGIHLGGKGGTPKGCYGTITQQQLCTAKLRIQDMEGVLMSASEGTFPTDAFGVSFTEDTPLHPKSPLNYLPEKSQFAYMGSCKGRSKTTDDVKPTIITQYVEEITGVSGDKYHPPVLKPEWFGFQVALENASHPGEPLPVREMQHAVADYKKPLVELVEKNDYWKKCRPLTLKETLNGIDGVRFIDAMKWSTSVGLPLSGKKTSFIEGEVGDFRMCDEMQKEYEKALSNLERGERFYPVIRASKKVEVLEKKDKCRIFYANPMLLTVLTRKYFLPIARFIQMNPLLSECAVGVNCQGPEWDQLTKHMFKHGKERVFAGDYSKYDQKIPSQLLLAAFRVLIDIAEKMNYSQQDLAIMRNLVSDIVYAYVSVNGDLVTLLEGTHISGTSLTAIINGIVGRINVGTYIFTVLPNTKNIRDILAFMTYGDDNCGSVKEGYDQINIRDYSQWLGKYGQIYTMPDKNSELVPYLSADNVEFLKRHSNTPEGLPVPVGALAEASIFKSLHKIVKTKDSPLTDEESAAINIDGAVREWFSYGRDKYETRREQMKEVAQRAGIRHLCSELDVTYDERVTKWYENYHDQL
jgi:hypothetical protein